MEFSVMQILDFIAIIGGAIGALSSLYIWLRKKKREKNAKQIEELGDYREELRVDNDVLEGKVDDLEDSVDSLKSKHTKLKAQVVYTVSYIQIIQNRFDLLRARIEQENGHTNSTMKILNKIEEDLKALEAKLSKEIEFSTEAKVAEIKEEEK